MKIKANNANSPIWKDVYSHSMLPEQLQPLYEMATNLWWVWNHEGAKLFGKIDSELWASTEGNPVLLLQSLSYKRIEEILADDVLMAEIKAVYSIFKDYVNVKPDQTKPSVRDIIMVGDRKFDVLGARVFGIETIGVLFGYGSKEEFEACDCRYLAENAEEMVRIILQ